MANNPAKYAQIDNEAIGLLPNGSHASVAKLHDIQRNIWSLRSGFGYPPQWFSLYFGTQVAGGSSGSSTYTVTLFYDVCPEIKYVDVYAMAAGAGKLQVESSNDAVSGANGGAIVSWLDEDLGNPNSSLANATVQHVGIINHGAATNSGKNIRVATSFNAVSRETLTLTASAFNFSIGGAYIATSFYVYGVGIVPRHA